ncbi:MAG: glycoside hydrolase family 2 [Alistipes senegalensis]|nr:glycoside hydrolase family 2 [Bacteroides cellulosilyticus]MCM1351990.1 glycoside hydrolase family 2 [Alistipes senegalensis]
MKRICWILLSVLPLCAFAQEVRKERDYLCTLTSAEGHGGDFRWMMKRADEVGVRAEEVSSDRLSTEEWLPAVVPGTVLNSLVYDGVYPEPYYGLNNKLESGLIPDLYHAGRDFYTYWFRTEFELTKEQCAGRKVWLQADGINYRAELWLNGSLVGNMAGMFEQRVIDITDKVRTDRRNVLAVKVSPVDMPGTIKPKGGKSFGANGEFQNGGNGEIGRNVTQLMTVGWDFYYLDGIRDRNTGIWRDLSIFTTGRVRLAHPFVKSELAHPNYDLARQTVSVEVSYPDYVPQDRKRKARIIGEIAGTGIRFEKEVELYRGEVKEVVFTPEEFPQLEIRNPRLWWPVNKGPQELYELTLKAEYDGRTSDSLTTRFGIREIVSSTDTPDRSRMFHVNGKPLFVRGTNWLPEAMLRTSDERTRAELRYTAQSGVNLIRFWGGGITESDYFFQLCDELGILVWQEFWMTGDTNHPVDAGLYYTNVVSTVKRIRNHPSLAYYVSSNESTEMPQMERLLASLDGTRGYQMQSECGGVHDGSPYKQVNIMSHYEDKASPRGSRVYGFNPEYGAPCLPTVECLREMMDEKDLWPINRNVWDYSDGNGFHLVASLYTDMTNEYGRSESIDEFAEKAQFVGALNYKSIWEVWNYNKFGYGDRHTSGVLYWYHNSAVRQVAGRMWDWSLEPTAALYAAQNACEPLHPQFDYLKNTVSIVNDTYAAHRGLRVTAEVYDLDMRRIDRKEAVADLPEDGVANDVLRLDFAASRTPVQFIRLRLFDADGKQVGSNFYWRSDNEYKGANTLTGPATAGFQALETLAPTKIAASYKTSTDDGRHYIDLRLKNTGRTVAFFTQVQWLDASRKPVRPSFYTDNFLCLMPGESRTIRIETALDRLPQPEYTLVVRAYNVAPRKFRIRIPRS